MRTLALLISFVVIGAAAIVVPMPVFEMSPGTVLMAEDIVTFPEPGTTADGIPQAGVEADGYLITTVRLDEPSLLGALASLFDGDSELVQRGSVVPAEADEDRFIRLQRELFDETTRLAVALGLRHAGVEVTVGGAGAEVHAIAKGVPAEDTVEVGDVIVEIDGRPVELAADVTSAIAGRKSGDSVRLVVERDDSTEQLIVELADLDELGQPGIGVYLRTVEAAIDLPVTLDLADLDVAGPSAGLMLTLATYDRYSNEPFATGLVVAGTGTIDALGQVGPIGGTAQKVNGAIDAGADVFLVPTENADEAMDAAGGRIEVIPVGRVEDAIAELQD